MSLIFHVSLQALQLWSYLSGIWVVFILLVTVLLPRPLVFTSFHKAELFLIPLRGTALYSPLYIIVALSQKNPPLFSLSLFPPPFYSSYTF